MVRIVEPSVEIISDIDGDKILKTIELCARNCYKSEGNITEDTTSAVKMINKLIELDHTAMLEHYNITTRLYCDVGCYDEDTYVLTENGWKLFKDVDVNEKVYTKDDNGNVFLYPITSKIEKDWDGDVHCYHSTQLDLKVTPDHNMWVFDDHKRSKKTKIWKFLKSEDMLNNTYSFDKSVNNSFTYSDRTINLGNVTRQCGFYKKEFVSGNYNNELFFELLGWWITDGSIERVGANHFTTTLFQTKQKGRDRIEYLLKSLDITYGCYKNRYRLHSVPLTEFILREFYVGKNDETGYSKSYDIKISDFIRNASTNEIKAFLDGVIGGDGSRYKDGRILIYTASKQFALDLIELCFKCGYASNYFRNDVSGYEYSFNQKEPIYVVSICRTVKHMFQKTEKNFSIEHYAGKVYCLELAEHHRLFVMRNGKTCWCGNCYKDLTRHRHCSFAIESTRFCSYNKDKFGNEITFIKPCNMDENSEIYHTWYKSMWDIEQSYMKMAELGGKPDQLRMLLPHSTAASVVVTANIREWRHIFSLRCAKAAHPSVRQIMLMTLNEFHKRIPVLFDDLYKQYEEDIQLFVK